MLSSHAESLKSVPSTQRLEALKQPFTGFMGQQELENLVWHTMNACAYLTWRNTTASDLDQCGDLISKWARLSGGTDM
jgi:hypothetical protein